MRKLNFKKFRVKLGAVLLAVFAVIVLIEALLLYRFLYRASQSAAPAAPLEPVLRIDFAASDLARAWFLGRQNFTIEAYELVSGGTGRENPFAEY